MTVRSIGKPSETRWRSPCDEPVTNPRLTLRAPARPLLIPVLTFRDAEQFSVFVLVVSAKQIGRAAARAAWPSFNERCSSCLVNPKRCSALASCPLRCSLTRSTQTTANALRSANLQKRYLDGEEVKYTSSFNLAELPQAIRVLKLAADYVESRESQVTLSE